MKPRRGRLGILLLFLLVSLPAAAADEGVPEVPPLCSLDDPLCQAGELLGAPVADPAPKVQPKTDQVLSHLGAFFAQAAEAIGDAAEQAADATAAAAVAAVAALVAGLRAYATFLLTLRPPAMDVPVFAGVAAGATAAAAGAVQASLWWVARKLAPYLGALPLFSRIDKDELLEHQKRARIYEFIRQNPGVHLSEISRGLEVPWGTCLHHLKKLRADRLILFKAVGHHKCFFVNGSGLSEKEMEVASVVKGGTLQKITAFIQAHPGTNLKELAEAVEVSSPLAAFHVRKLEKAGLVEKTRDGKSIRLETVNILSPQFLGAGALPSAAPAGVWAAPMAP